MNKITKSIILAVTPTVTILHLRWLVFLIGMKWSDVHPAFAFFSVIAATFIATGVLFIEMRD